MTTRALLIGLDSIEPTLVDAWAAQGLLPTFAWLGRNGATGDLRSPVPGLAGGVWPETNHGVSASKLGKWNLLTPHIAPDSDALQVATEPQYWQVAAEAGRRTIAVDPVYASLVRTSGARQLVDWGLHDVLPIHARSSPPEWVSAITERYGTYPIDNCDSMHGATMAGYLRLSSTLEKASEVKTRLITDLLQSSDWDLATVTFGEGHCAGHQMFHLVKPETVGSDQEEHDTILRVYRALDTALSRVIETAGSDTLIMAVALKGMGPSLGGPQLVPGVLQGLGLGPKRRWRRRVWDYVPRTVKSRMRKTLPDQVRKTVSMGAEPTGYGGSKAIYIRSDQDAAVRLNLIGRDMNGVVHPGDEADRLLRRLREEFLGLRHTEFSDEPIVDRVIICDEQWAPDTVSSIPDLVVEFRRDLGVLNACESDSVGVVRAPMMESRTGNHTSHHRVWAAGPTVAAGARFEARTTDLAPTLLAHIDVPAAPGMDGTPVPVLRSGS